MVLGLRSLNLQLASGPVLARTPCVDVLVLFGIAMKGRGFAVDEPADRLREVLMLPDMHEEVREQLEATLRPIKNPRAVR